MSGTPMATCEVDEAGGEFIHVRAVLLGAILAVVFSGINGYLQINLGMSFGYGAVAVIIGYSLFHRLQGGSCRRELSFLMIASVSQMAVYNTLAFILYMIEVEGEMSFPGWLAPSKEVVLTKDLSLHYWIKPVGILIFAMAISMVAGVIFFTILKEGLNRSPKMVWPSQSANTKLVDACMMGGGSARLVAVSAVIGFVVTFLQHLPSFWGIDLTMIDLSGHLPEGSLLVISFSVAFASIGYLINVNTSLSLMASGLLSYLFISPYLVNRGLIDYNPNVMGYYNDYLFKFAVSPAIGILLLGGILLSIAVVLRNIVSKEDNSERERSGIRWALPYIHEGLTR
ncbi:MAG: OPT/YSL family transporter [Candidatus Bathyarchaeia archaeon]